MTDFTTLSYTSTSEIPTPSYTWSLKRLPLLGGAFPYRPLYRVPPPPQTPQRVVSCIPIINDDEDLLLHLIYIMPLENCTFGSFLHKDQWTEILLANNSAQKRDKDGVWLRSRQIWFFESLPFQTFDLFLIDCEPLYPFLFFPSQPRCPVTALFYYYYKQANFGSKTFL